MKPAPAPLSARCRGLCSTLVGLCLHLAAPAAAAPHPGAQVAPGVSTAASPDPYADEEDADEADEVAPDVAAASHAASPQRPHDAGRHGAAALPTRHDPAAAPAPIPVPTDAAALAPSHRDAPTLALHPAAKARTSFLQGSLTATGTIVGAANTYATLQSGAHLRAGRFVSDKLFLAADVELGGGAGPAVGGNRFVFTAGGALGLLWDVHPRLALLPSFGLGYGLLTVGTTPGIDARVEHGLLMDFRLGLVTGLTPRLNLIVTPVLQPTLVHSGGGSLEGAHVTLGLTAGVVYWL